MKERIDERSPVPLYWQVAEALRYRVATGELTPGERLPSLREAAEAWGVNMHTVRRAYGKLAEAGIVRVRPRSGTVVLGPPDGDAASAVARAARNGDRASWLREVARRGREQWGLEPRELGAALAALPWPGGVDRVCVVECSESQSADLARQLADRWRVLAEPWSLERAGEPPGDVVVLATYFHYNDIRVRWPHRFPRVRFVATHPDHGIRDELERLRPAGDGPLEVILLERDEAMARNIAADLVRVLPEDRFSVRSEVGAPESATELPSGPVLFPPRVWAGLPEGAKLRSGFIQVRYVFDRGEIERLARELGWEEAR